MTHKRLIMVPALLAGTLEILIWLALCEAYMFALRDFTVSLLTVFGLVCLMYIGAKIAHWAGFRAFIWMQRSRFRMEFLHNFSSWQELESFMVKEGPNGIESLLLKNDHEDDLQSG